jgi:CheY-like chemotaxis protein
MGWLEMKSWASSVEAERNSSDGSTTKAEGALWSNQLRNPERRRKRKATNYVTQKRIEFDWPGRRYSGGIGGEMNALTSRMPESRIRVVVADDHPVVRGMVRTALQQHPDFVICGEAENGAEAVEQVRLSKPDVAVLNVTMPLVNGFEAAREIKKQVPETAIVILSSHADKYFVAEAQKIGVRAYVSKTKIGQSLVEALKAAVEGEDFVVLE